MDVAAIIPAAGAGRRLGGSARKPFVLLSGVPLLMHTLRAFQESPAVRWIIPVVRSGEEARVARLTRRYRITKSLPPRVGGRSRAESVANGFAALPREAAWVLIHDGGRPCVRGRLIDQAIRSAKRHGAVACGLPASLTVKAVDDTGGVRLTLDREHLWFVQTPQVFRRDWLTQALQRVDGTLQQFPDDAAILESAGFHVHMMRGDPLNIKVTTKEDVLLAETILRVRGSRLTVQGKSLEPRT
mgnify:CR=1 FL=1